MVGDEGFIGLVVFFRQHFDGREVRSKTGTMQLVGLLVMITLGDEYEAVARGKFAERGRNVGKKLDLLIGDGLGEAPYAAVLFVCHGGIAELLKTGDQGFAEAVESVTVDADSLVFDSVEMAADLFDCVNAVVEVGDKAGDGTLKVDIVLPKRVVGVDQKSLVGWATCDLSRGVHRLIIGSSGGA